MAVDRALHDILQLANITRPAVVQQRLPGAIGKAWKQRQAQLAAHLDREVLCHQHYIALALAQRRELHHVKGQPVEKIGAEGAVAYHFRQIGIGGAYQTDVNLQRLAAADALQLAILNHPQQLLLNQHRGRSQFVEKQRAAVGALEAARMATLRPGKGPSFMTKQLGVQQVFIKGGTVQRDKGPVPTPGEKVQAVGDQLLTRSALTNNQHRLIQRGEA